MSEKTSTALKLYGTDEPVQPMRNLRAGPVTCQFDQGALRFIKVHGVEAIRNIAFSVRDKDWGTYLPVLSDMRIDQADDSFSISFDAVCSNDGEAPQEIRYKVQMTGAADGTITLISDITTVTDFLTNRTGFVVLHPINGVSGNPVTVETVNGDTVQSEFPDLIDPIQPFKNIRALTHEVISGVSICCRMTGDTFEMEDHRQWNDASYKTYSRPIALPWPFTIDASETFQQSVTLSLSGEPDNLAQQQEAVTVDQSPKPSVTTCVVTIGQDQNPQPMPQIGLGLEPEHLAGAVACQEQLRQLAPQQLVMWYELGKHSSEHLGQAAELSRSIGCNIELQAVIPDEDFKAEITELAAQCRDANLTPHALTVSPALYLNSIMPGPSWPDVTALSSIYDEVRRQFPGIAIGGGMLSFFTELNRHHPPIEHLDFVTHASNTITHASDDITVIENLEALPYIIKTCRTFSGDAPYHVGPSSIALRFNPYGSKTMDNPDNQRIAMARMDPRQRGLVNAAWTLGYAAHLVRGGVACINLHAPTGEFGIFNYPEDWPRPGYDNTSKQVYPVYPVLAGLVEASAKPQLKVHSSHSREVEALAYKADSGTVVWIANLTSEPQKVEIKNLPMAYDQGDQGDTMACEIATLSLDTFDQCTQTSSGFEQTSTNTDLPTLDLGPHSVVRITTSI